VHGEWARVPRPGVTGKEHIVVKLAVISDKKFATVAVKFRGGFGFDLVDLVNSPTPGTFLVAFNVSMTCLYEPLGGSLLQATHVRFSPGDAGYFLFTSII
jgi:hypothetical protein